MTIKFIISIEVYYNGLIALDIPPTSRYAQFKNKSYYTTIKTR